MTTQPALQTVVIHILPNISWSKCKQTIKFGQLQECNMRNIFLEKQWTECWGETSPRPFSKKLKLNISLDQSSWKFYTVCFYCMTSWGLSRYNETKLQTTCFHLNLNFFKKIKRGLELVSHDFGEKDFSCYILLIDQISLSGCLYFVGYWEICVLRFLIKQVVTS